MFWKALLALGLLVLVLLAPACLYTVDRTEFVHLTQFGRKIAVLDGADDEQAGLHVKWPWPIQAVQRLDRRLHYFDLPGAELTRDAEGTTIDKTLTIDAYVCWRIADSQGADQFVRSVGTIDRAQLVLGQRIASELGSAVAELESTDLISTRPERIDAKREELRRRLLEVGNPSLKESALRDYGIEVVDVRLRRTNHPVAVREAIFVRIRSERAKKVAVYQSKGETEASKIRSDTQRTVEKMKLAADSKAKELRIKADAEAYRIRSEAGAKDSKFFAFLQDLEAYQQMLGDGKSVLLLSTHREIFNNLFNPPRSAKEMPKKKGDKQ